MSDPGRFGWVEVDAGGAVRGFLEKGGKSGPGWINGGIYLTDRSVLQTIPPGQNASLETESSPAWVGRGLYGFRSNGQFVDIETPESFALTQQFFEQENQA
jgi:NDP-sugar pyrophosphorylase family protein